MRAICVTDVKDGLCMAIRTLFGDTILIDCGSQQGPCEALNGLRNLFEYFYSPDVFLLSHFHLDHYNGLLLASKYPPHPYRWKIREVYYPGIPEFKEKAEFMAALFAMNLKVFGSETGIMEYDFLMAISRINIDSFRYKPVFKGEKISINGSTFEVLWPPPTIEGAKTLSVIKHALKYFKIAMEQDEELRQLHERVEKEGILEKYGKNGEIREPKKRENTDEIIKRNYTENKLPDIVIKANNSLRKAANHLSLSLFEDNRLLFLGDTEGFEIKQIVDYLKSINRKKFYVFVTPHHGTHWDNSLEEIGTIYAITSNGEKLSSKMVSNFKQTSKMSFATWVNGDIVVPVFPTSRLHHFPLRGFYDDEF